MGLGRVLQHRDRYNNQGVERVVNWTKEVAGNDEKWSDSERKFDS